LARSLAGNEDEVAIIAMLLDDYYQEMLHAPPPQPSHVETVTAESRTSLNRSRSRRHRKGRK
jgi:ATP-dependent RNA helicase DeaD